MWHPIDTAPKDGAHILVYDPDDGIQVAHWGYVRTEFHDTDNTVCDGINYIDGGICESIQITARGVMRPARRVDVRDWVGDYVSHDGDIPTYSPTHWRPLPPPPTESF